jgi:hypothetical protein
MQALIDVACALDLDWSGALGLWLWLVFWGGYEMWGVGGVCVVCCGESGCDTWGWGGGCGHRHWVLTRVEHWGCGELGVLVV